MLGSASALSAPPTRPGDLRADVYSGTAAELFWSRSSDQDGLVRGYEVRRDGAPVATLDALSFFTDTLTDGETATFTVTAIDFDGERSRPASVSVVGGDRAGGVGDSGGRPPPPANLRAAIYSTTAAEVFWDRVDQRGLFYVVSIDGEVIDTTDGTSAFLSGLVFTNRLAVDVVAIDANGQRSGAAVVNLGGSGEPAARTPPAPMNARIEVYSTSAAELFFDRAPASANVIRTRVERNGSVIGTTPGDSFFDDSRRPGVNYRYSLVAVNADEAESVATTIEPSDGIDASEANPTAPDGATASRFLPAALASPLLARIEPGSPLSVTNHETFIRAFYAIADTTLLRALLLETRRVQDELRATATGASSRFVAQSVSVADGMTSEIVFACPDGGTVRTVFEFADTPIPSSVMDFRRCRVGGDTLSGITREAPTTNTDSGQVGRSRTFGEAGIGRDAEGERFTLETASGLTTAFAGRNLETRVVLGFGLDRSLDTRDWSGDWQLSGPGTNLSVTELDVQSVRWLLGSEQDSNGSYFNISGTVTNGREITATNRRFFRGRVRSEQGVSGVQTFSDDRGGILDLTAGRDPEGGEQRTHVRIDTDGVILDRTLPAELEAALFLPTVP